LTTTDQEPVAVDLTNQDHLPDALACLAGWKPD